MFLGYEEASKVYRIYDIEADQAVISRDVTFDESTFGFVQTLLQDVVDDAVLDFDSMSISSEPATTELKQTDKRKNRSNNQEQVFKRPACHGAGLEEISAPDDFESRHQKRRSNARANRDKEQKDNDMDDDDDDDDDDEALEDFFEDED